MRRSLKLCVVIGLFLLVSCAKGRPIMTVYFMPFSVSTYVPVTPKDIACQAEEKWTITDIAQASTLITILNYGDKANFDNNRVRMLVSSNGKSYYIDQDGVALYGKITHKIDLGRIDAFRKSMSPNTILQLRGTKRLPGCSSSGDTTLN